MKQILRVFLLFLLNIGWMVIPAQAHKVHFTETTVCAVLKHRQRFSEKSVSLHAVVLADGMHGIILIDDDCPDQGLPLDLPRPKADQSVSDFIKLVSDSGTPGTRGRRVSGSFFGKLKRDVKNGKIYYALLSVKDLKVAPLPNN